MNRTEKSLRTSSGRLEDSRGEDMRTGRRAKQPFTKCIKVHVTPTHVYCDVLQTFHDQSDHMFTSCMRKNCNHENKLKG